MSGTVHKTLLGWGTFFNFRQRNLPPFGNWQNMGTPPPPPSVCSIALVELF